MSPQQWTQLNLRLEEQFSHLHERLNALQAALHSMEQTFSARLDAHAAYHRAHEHRWGMQTLARRHPLRLALISFFVAGCLALTWPERLDAITRLLRLILLRSN